MLKKKSPGGLKLLLFVLFIMLLGLFSTSYAYMSADYLDYCLATVTTNPGMAGSNYTQFDGFKNGINNLTATEKQQLLTNINNYLDTINMPNLDDRNIIAISSIQNSWSLKFLICNNSSPQGYTSLDFFKLRYNYCNKANNNTDKIYYVTFQLQNKSYLYGYIDGFNNNIEVDIVESNTTFNSDGTIITCRNCAVARNSTWF